MDQNRYTIKFLGEDFSIFSDTNQTEIIVADPVGPIVEDCIASGYAAAPIQMILETIHRRELAALRRGDAEALFIKVNFKKQTAVKLLKSK